MGKTPFQMGVTDKPRNQKDNCFEVYDSLITGSIVIF